MHRVYGGLRVWGGGVLHVLLPAVHLRKNRQTSDYDTNANLNVSQRGVWPSQSGARMSKNTALHIPHCP